MLINNFIPERNVFLLSFCQAHVVAVPFVNIYLSTSKHTICLLSTSIYGLKGFYFAVKHHATVFKMMMKLKRNLDAMQLMH